MKQEIKRYPKLLTIIRCYPGKHLYMKETTEASSWKSCVLCGRVKPC
jgi:hypothetical protein